MTPMSAVMAAFLALAVWVLRPADKSSYKSKGLLSKYSPAPGISINIYQSGSTPPTNARSIGSSSSSYTIKSDDD